MTEAAPTRKTFPDAVHAVEFYPSLDDYIYISTKLTNSITSKPFTTYAYYVFLFTNTIVFPAYLWLNGYFGIGLGVFVLNFAAVRILVPRVNKDASRQYYAQLFGDSENKIARVELSDDGLLYDSEHCYSFWAWERIKSEEETEDSIFFFCDGNGLSVRKSGFAYDDQRKAFSEFAKIQLKPMRVGQLSE